MNQSLEAIAESVDYGVTASAANSPIGPKFLRITDIQDGQVDWDSVPWCKCDRRESEASRLKAGDIVFARTGATTGKSYLINQCPEDTVFASYLIRVRLKKIADPNFVGHFFHSTDYWKQITKGARGAAQPGVNATTLKQLQIPLPPLAEQKRIAAILDAADALRAKRREALAQLDALLQSTFLTLFGDPVANPMGWVVVPFAKVGETRLGKMLDKGRQTGDHQRPYLANTNVKWGRFELTDLREMDFNPADRIEFSLRLGDLLICEGGEVGRCAVWKDELQDCYFQKAIHRCRVYSDKAVPDFLQYFMWFMASRGGFKDFVSTSTIAHLTGEKLRRLPVPLPPLPLQQKFAAIVESIERQKTTQRAHLAELDALFAALQHRAFRGEL